MKPDYPLVSYPTIIAGEIYADQLRLESLDGSSILLTPEQLPLGGWLRQRGKFLLLNFKPIQYQGKMWGVTHLQKQSKRGWIRTSPDCYHWWWFWKLQTPGISGSESGIYFRKPFSWRWDIAGTVLDGELRHWIWTKGYLGGHWD